MIITISLMDQALAQFAQAVAQMGDKGRVEMERALREGGDKLRTEVRRALKAQTSVLRYGTIVRYTSGHQSGLEYTIRAVGKGLPISEFATHWSRSKHAQVRWSPRVHWKLQPRSALGRFGPLPDVKGAGVSAVIWQRSISFQRSFTGPKGPAAIRGGTKRSIRSLFGAALPDELVRGQVVETFESQAQSQVMNVVVKRLGRLMP